MGERTRYRTRLSEGTLFVEGEDDDWLAVGAMDDVLALLGGEKYTIEYTKKQAAAAWLDTDEDDAITVDLRERLSEMTFDADFVAEIEDASTDAVDDADHTERTERFARLMAEILESAGRGATANDESV